jgi:integrase
MTPDPKAMGSIEAREAWAKRFAETLGRRRAERQAGAPAMVGKPIADALKQYFKEAKHLRARTELVYKEGTREFEAWATRQGIKGTEELTPERLWAFRQWVVGGQKYRTKEGGRRGETEPSGEKRSPGTSNRYLRTMSTVLNVWRRGGLVPQLHSDDIRDRLGRLTADRNDVEFLSAVQCKQLLIAALDHDKAAVRGGRPIAPYVVGLLLSGMRPGEGTGLEWPGVDLEQGWIRLTAAETKTKSGRRVSLAESPALAKLLAAMKPDPAEGSVFGLTYSTIHAAQARLIAKYNAPDFTWQTLRRTCATFAWNMPGANPYAAARRAGHGVAVAESRYVDLVKVPADARTLEAAMQIEGEVERVIAAVGG